MSGGSYNYAYFHVEEFASNLQITSPLREAFRDHLHKVAKAMHDIEWVDSCDYGPGDEDVALRACFVNPKATVLDVMTCRAEKVLSELRAALGGDEE